MNKNKLKLIAISAVFVLPIIFAFLLQPLKDVFIEKGSMSHGQLISPQVKLEELGKLAKITHTWTLLAFAGKHCNAACLDSVYKIQQIRLTQGEESKRISRMLISDGELAVKDLENLNPYIGTQFVRLESEQYKAVSSIMKMHIKNGVMDNIYLIDPLGYYMMTFSNELVPKGIITDLRLLLKNSRVG